MSSRVVSLLLALAVACLPLGVGWSAQARAAENCCATGHSQGPASCPGCPVAPDNGGGLSCCVSPVMLAPFPVPPEVPGLPHVEAVRAERTDHWTIRRERPAIPPPR